MGSLGVEDRRGSPSRDDKGGYRQINKALNICAFDEYLQGQAARLPDLKSVEQITPRVLRVLGQNPGRFTFQGTNTYIIGTGTQRLLIDTSGGEPEWAELISSTLPSLGISLSHVLLTHWHGDHTGGVPDLVRMYPHLLLPNPLSSGGIFKNDPEGIQKDISDGQVFRVEGATVRALHSPGHSEDHMCFVLEEERAMFTGDNVLGHGTSAVEDLGTFMASLEKMRVQGCRTGYPAHGEVIADFPAKMESELALKRRREEQVMRALGRVREKGGKSAAVGEIVGEIFGTGVDEGTRSLALEPFIAEVLRKLAGDGLVAFEMRGGKRKWYSVQVASC